jgi:hypothetical protein
MPPIRPSRQLAYVLALATVVLSQQIISQTQSPPPAQPSTASTTTGNSKPEAKCADSGTYVNSKGQTTKRPETCSGPPEGATAHCRDGTYSFSQTRRGTCSRHGGVSKWL